MRFLLSILRFDFLRPVEWYRHRQARKRSRTIWQALAKSSSQRK